MNEYIPSDPLLCEAVELADRGDVTHLEKLLNTNPGLVARRSDKPEEGYFKNPPLLAFVAQNPIRAEKMPSNTVEVAKVIIATLKREHVFDWKDQIDYTLALVCSGRVPRECGLQIPLIDLLINEGADPNKDDNAALIHYEMEAVNRLLYHGAVVTLNITIGTDRKEDFERIVVTANKEQVQAGLALASFFGRPSMIVRLIELGAEVNAFNPNGFHSHSLPLHQAVFSGSLEAVKVLVEAGADLNVRDKIYQGTPLGWAEYEGHHEIANFLRGVAQKK